MMAGLHLTGTLKHCALRLDVWMVVCQQRTLLPMTCVSSCLTP